MGIFDFVKNAGREAGIGKDDTGGSEEERLDELKEGNKLLRLILEMDQGIENPKVKYDDGVATVSGKAPSQEVKENTILVIGNVKGVRKVDDRIEVDDSAPQSTFYTVESGDTLSGIAKKKYGDASRHREIFEANRATLDDPDRIYPGQVLRIPGA